MSAVGCLRGATGATSPDKMLSSEEQEEVQVSPLVALDLQAGSLRGATGTTPPDKMLASEEQEELEVASLVSIDLLLMPSPGCLREATGITLPGEKLCSEGQEEAEAPSNLLEGLSLLAAPTATGPPATSTCASTTVATSSQALEPTATSTATSVAAVLGNGDLLSEILLRVPYPSCLVRAATVSKFWLSNASDPQFLKRFLKINPTPLLGFYVVADNLLHPRFVRAAHANDPEIAPMLTLASTQFDVWEDTPVTIWDCRNGKILVEIGGKLEVRDYLTRPCSIAAYPQSPLKLVLNRSFTYQHHEFLPCNGTGHEYYRLAIGHRDGSIIVCLSLLCGHIWVNRNSDIEVLPEFATCSDFLVPYGKLGESKLYLVTTCDLIIIVDIKTMKMLFARIPKDEVEECYDLDLCPGHSGIEMYLIGLTQLNLNIWSYAASETNEDTWHLLNCIPIQDVFRGSIGVDELSLWGVGEKLEFVLLKLDNSIYRLDIQGQNVIKAFELQPEDGELERIYPCLMIWPPTFPLRGKDTHSPGGFMEAQKLELVGKEVEKEAKMVESCDHLISQNTSSMTEMEKVHPLAGVKCLRKKLFPTII